MTFIATYSYRSTLSLRRCSVKLSMRSMAGPSPSSLAWLREIHLPSDTRISPGELMERKQHENSRSSHHALINSAIWSSIWRHRGSSYIQVRHRYENIVQAKFSLLEKGSSHLALDLAYKEDDQTFPIPKVSDTFDCGRTLLS
ncbi:hypothetical protein J6590_054550 [Homalodisca vitripennis]|nr:hypothetical protein J6590_054550 [Homalodisca vitripennis]